MVQSVGFRCAYMPNICQHHGDLKMQYYLSPNCDVSNLNPENTHGGRPLYNIKNHMKKGGIKSERLKFIEQLHDYRLLYYYFHNILEHYLYIYISPKYVHYFTPPLP